MNTQNTIEKERLDTQRHRLCFIRSSLFFGAGGLFCALVTTAFILWQMTGTDYTLWLLFPLLIAATIGMYIYYKRHTTITATDRTLMNIWMYALLICIYVGIWQGSQAALPPMGFLTMGASIAVGVTSEIYRMNSGNRSNVRGSLVGLGWLALSGAFLSAHIFVAAHDGARVGEFILTLAAMVILFFGTGAVLRYHEHRNHV